ncbi:19159_t:CDS:2, partial [Funneliformis geosporum]
EIIMNKIINNKKEKKLSQQTIEKIEDILESKKRPYEKKIALFNVVKNLKVGEIESDKKKRINYLLEGHLHSELAKQYVKTGEIDYFLNNYRINYIPNLEGKLKLKWDKKKQHKLFQPPFEQDPDKFQKVNLAEVLEFMEKVGELPSRRLLSTDESGFPLNLVPRRDVVEGAVDTEIFTNFVNNIKLPDKEKYYLLIDRLPVHKTKKVGKALEDKNIERRLIVACNPYLNPVEEVFNVIKQYVRKEKPTTERKLRTAVPEINYEKNSSLENPQNWNKKTRAKIGLGKLKDQEAPQILFIERCLKLLKNGGRMAIVLPDGIYGNNQLGYVRKLIMKQARIVAVIDVPKETFQPNTGTKTSILVLQKTNNIPTDYPVFMCVAETCGHDRRGNQKGDDDIVKIPDEFRK